MMEIKRILVLGGGFAGLWSAVGAARKLDELGLGPDAVEVTLVNRDAFHSIRVRNYEADLSSMTGNDMTPSVLTYFDDLSMGQTFHSGTVTVELEEIKRFAAQFDPQPFHLDEAAGAQSFFGGLVASGWHTAGLTMRLIVTSELKIAGGMIGMGVDQVRWPRPVRAGDVLRVESEVIELRPSRSNPERGIVKMRSKTLNQNGETVMEQTATLIVPVRPSA
jgi:acyl dehydratase